LFIKVHETKDVVKDPIKQLLAEVVEKNS